MRTFYQGKTKLLSHHQRNFISLLPLSLLTYSRLLSFDISSLVISCYLLVDSLRQSLVAIKTLLQHCDILTDLAVISIPMEIISMANSLKNILAFSKIQEKMNFPNIFRPFQEWANLEVSTLLIMKQIFLMLTTFPLLALRHAKKRLWLHIVRQSNS